MGVVGAQEEEHDRDAEQEFLGGSVLGPIIDLLPHVQVVIGTPIELEGNSADIVEHDVRAKHVCYVGQCPRGLLRHAGDDVVEDL